jgi:hypothetical protein
MMVKIEFKVEDTILDMTVYERLSAEQVGEDLYELQNIPFFTKLVSEGDVIRCRMSDSGLIAEEVVQYSGNSTIRVWMKCLEERSGVKDALIALGCGIEQSHLEKLFAICVPVLVTYQDIRDKLEYFSNCGALDYEESCISERHSNQEYCIREIHKIRNELLNRAKKKPSSS